MNRLEFLEAVKKDGLHLQHASTEFKNDIEIAEVAVSNFAYALKFVSDELKNNFSVVSKAVAQDGRSLLFASTELKNNPTLVSVAVSNCGVALEDASPTLQDFKPVVLKAVAQDGRALIYASLDMKADKEIVLTAIQNSPSSLEFASKAIQELCKNKNPIKALQVSILADELAMSQTQPRNIKAIQQTI